MSLGVAEGEPGGAASGYPLAGLPGCSRLWNERALRRKAALLLAGNLPVDRLWIPSKANPADGPSRGRAVGVFDPG